MLLDAKCIIIWPSAKIVNWVFLYDKDEEEKNQGDKHQQVYEDQVDENL